MFQSQNQNHNQGKVTKKGEILFQHEQIKLIDTNFFTDGSSMCSTDTILSSTNCDNFGDEIKLSKFYEIAKNRKNNSVGGNGQRKDGREGGYPNLIHGNTIYDYLLGKDLFRVNKGEDHEQNESNLSKLKLFFKRLSLDRQQQPNDLFLPSLVVSSIIFQHVMKFQGNENIENSENWFLTNFAQSYFDKQYCSDTLESDEEDEEEYEKVLECWTILLQAFPSPIQQNDTDYFESQKSQISVLRMSPSAFRKLQKFIKRNCLFHVSIYHPLHHFIANDLLEFKDEELIDILAAIDDMAGAKEKEGITKRTHPMTYCNTRNLISSWRKAAHLVQATTSYDMELEPILGSKLFEFVHSLKKDYVLIDPTLKLNHSCVPNCLVEADIDCNSNLKGSIIALHDIQLRETLYMSKICNIDEDESRRAIALRKFYGPDFICECPRCRLERHWDKHDEFKVELDEDASCNEITFEMSAMKNVGDLAMQHGRFDDACNIYDTCLKNDPDPMLLGEILHAKAASFLERGMFITAQNMWMQSKEDCPTHKEICLQNLKRDAYETKSVIASQSQVINFGKQQGCFDTIIPKLCFLTKDSSPLLSRSECNQVIQWAESAAQERKDGWTTSRHYAVPTTDIPIHEVPVILKMFNEIFMNRLRPLLALQFGEDEVGKDGCRIHIHDAFVVKYDSRKQRHLPLHRDQSTYSFTIALNDSTEYDGGGTFIAKLNDSVRPTIGGALSFRGDKLLHGGDPLIRGRRYIIVAFCFGAKEPSSSIVRQAKRRRFYNDNSTRRKEKDRGGDNQETSFSFGFKL